LLRNRLGSRCITVRDLTLDHNKNANDPTPINSTSYGVTDFTIAPIHWVETYDSAVENCEILNAAGDAYSDQAQDGLGLTPSHAAVKKCRNAFRGNIIDGASRHGVHIGTCYGGAIVTGNIIRNCGVFGYFY